MFSLIWTRAIFLKNYVCFLDCWIEIHALSDWDFFFLEAYSATLGVLGWKKGYQKHILHKKLSGYSLVISLWRQVKKDKQAAYISDAFQPLQFKISQHNTCHPLRLNSASKLIFSLPTSSWRRLIWGHALIYPFLKH